MEYKDRKLYNFIKPLAWCLIKLFKPVVVGEENIPKTGRILLAGNHTKWLDSILLIGVQERKIHFLAKEELFHGPTKWIMEGIGCVPVNRKIHDKSALASAIEFLKNDLCVAIFPEGTINRTNDVIMPFKIGAVKASYEANSKLVPFIITGKYKLFRKSIKIEFLKPITIKEDLDNENQKLMKLVEKKLIEGGKGK